MHTLRSSVLVLVAAAMIAVASSAVTKTEPVPVLSYSVDGPNPDGSYSYSYETGNGIQAREQGQLKKSSVANEEDSIHVEGSYSYKAPDGTPIALNYVADENGYQPKGDHLPTAPPLPPAIIKALEYIAAHPEEDKETRK